MEGRHCFNASMPNNCEPPAALCGWSPACLDPAFTLPLLEFAHAGGACSIPGGQVYLGCLSLSSRPRQRFPEHWCWTWA